MLVPGKETCTLEVYKYIHKRIVDDRLKQNIVSTLPCELYRTIKLTYMYLCKVLVWCHFIPGRLIILLPSITHGSSKGLFQGGKGGGGGGGGVCPPPPLEIW